MRTRETLDDLIDRNYGSVYALAHRMLGNPDDARDVAQETFTRVVASFKSSDRIRSFRAWVLSIAANHLRDLFRKRKEVPMAEGAEAELPIERPPDLRMLDDENRERVLGAMQSLPFTLRIVVAMVFTQDQPYDVVAEALGITRNVVRVRLFRGLHAMREFLEEKP